jgi:uncharacterized protein
MNREFDNYLSEWKMSQNRKPLIIRGARQVGKTYTVRKFAKEHYSFFLEINLEQESSLSVVFESLNPQKVIDELTAIFQIPVFAGKTLIFIDEIQAVPKAILALRYFYEQQPDIHIIAAGSLLDHTLNDMTYSMPVGRIEFAYMYPLTFTEFLSAINEHGLVEAIRNYRLSETFSLAIHNRILEFLRLYFFVGGMPEAVNYYVLNKELSGIEKIHESLISTFQFDFGKYGTKKQQENLKSVLYYVANNVGLKVKYANINKNIHSNLLKDAFLKLELSRVVHLIRRTKSVQVPITQMQDENVFKAILFDIGLLNHIAKIALSDIPKLILSNEGGLAEQFVFQELIASGKTFMDQKMHYWLREAKNSNAEIDCLFQIGNKIYPVEIKAGKRGTLKSLHVFLAEKKMDTGIRLNSDLPNIGFNLSATINLAEIRQLNYNLISLPLYFAFYLKTLISDI